MEEPPTSPARDDSLNVFFILGGPGSGKSTQCERLCAQRGFTHLGVRDLLDAEALKEDSPWKATIEQASKHSLMSSKEMTVGLLGEALSTHNSQQSSNGRFVIDGFPRNLDQAQHFEQTIVEPLAVIVLDNLMTQRSRLRALFHPQPDNTRPAVTEILQIFQTETKQVLEHYKKRKMLIQVDATGSRGDVQMRLLIAVDGVLRRKGLCRTV